MINCAITFLESKPPGISWWRSAAHVSISDVCTLQSCQYSHLL